MTKQLTRTSISLLLSLFLTLSCAHPIQSRAATSTWTVAQSDGTANVKYTHRSSDLRHCKVVPVLDVSSNNGSIDWAQVKAAGITRVMLRAASSAVEADDASVSTDRKFEEYYQEATAAGFEIGVYMFSQALTQKEAGLHAEYVTELLEDKEIDLPVVFDYEPAQRLNNAALSKAKKTNIAKAFCEEIKDAGYTPMIYASASFLNDEIDGAELSKKYDIWMARYNTVPVTEGRAGLYDGAIAMWQFSDAAIVDGISGCADVNFYYMPSDTKVAKVTGLSKSKKSGIYKLNWKKVAGADGYQIYRATTKKGTYKKISSVTKTGYSDKRSSRAYYKVRAFKIIHGRNVYGKFSAIK